MATELEMANRGINNPRMSGGIESSTAENSSMHIAARNGDIETLKKEMIHGWNEEEQYGDGWTLFHIACGHGWLQMVRYLAEKLGESRTIEIAEMVDNNKRTALHLAAIGGHIDVADELIKQKVNINVREEDGLTPLQSATTAGQADMMEFLLDNKYYELPDTLLHLACQYGHTECVTRLITRKADVSLVCKFDGREGVSCIDLAIDNGHSSVVEVLISDKDKFMSVMQHPYVKNGSIMTPFRRLIQDIPEMAKKALDMCMKQDTEVQCNLLEDTDMIRKWRDGRAKQAQDRKQEEQEKLLEDTDMTPKGIDDGVLSSDETRITEYLENKAEVKKNHPLLMMINDAERQPLFHPLVNGLLQYKWSTVGRTVYIANVSLHVILIICITTFALIVPSPKSIYSGEVLQKVQIASYNDTSHQNQSLKSCQMQKYLDNSTSSNSPPNQPAATACTVFILIIVAIKMAAEGYLMVRARLKYFRMEKLAKWTLYVTAILLVLPAPCCYYREPWQWELATVAVVMVWIELTLQFHRFDNFGGGIYVTMFLQILDTFLRVILGASFPIVGFAIGFHMLFYNKPEFKYEGNSIHKTVVMVTGGFDFQRIFYTTELPIIYPPASYVLFVLFFSIMAIVFNNQMISLAIDDVGEIRKKAKLTMRIKEVKLALDVEYLLPERCRKWLERFSRCCSLERFSRCSSSDEQRDIIQDELEKLTNQNMKPMVMSDTERRLLKEQDIIKSELKKLMAMIQDLKKD